MKRKQNEGTIVTARVIEIRVEFDVRSTEDDRLLEQGGAVVGGADAKRSVNRSRLEAILSELILEGLDHPESVVSFKLER